MTHSLLPLFACVAALPAPQQGARLLSPPQALTHPGDIASAAFAPLGNRVVFVDTHPRGDLWSVSIDGGAPLRLNSPTLGGEVAPLFRIDAVSQRVLFRDRNLALFSTPLDGSGEAVLLLGGAVLNDFRATPSGTSVLFRAPQQLAGPVHLWSTAITGGLPSLLFLGGFNGVGVTGFRILPDSSQVVFRADLTPGVLQLFRLPLSGSPTSVLLSGPSATIGDVEPDFELTPDGSLVVFRADAGRDGEIDLLAASVSSPTVARKLNANSVPGGDVVSFLLSPDGSRVLYLGELETPGVRELFSVPIDQSALPARVSTPLAQGGAVLDGYRHDTRSTRIVFRVALADEVVALDSAPLDGSGPAVRLVGPLHGRDSVADDFQITTSGRRVVFRADPDGDHVFDLFSVPTSGGAAPVRLDAPGGAVSDFALGPGSVFFRAEQATSGVPELFAGPVNGSHSAVRVHPGLPFGHAAGSYTVSPDGRKAIFLADPFVRGVFELFRVSADSAPSLLRLSADAVRDPGSNGEVQDFLVAGQRALYRGAQEVEDVVGLYSVPLDASSPPLALSPLTASAGSVLTRALTPDQTRVVFVQGSEHGHRELYAAPVDGSAPTRRLDAPAHARCDVEPRFVLTPDGWNALFVADQELDETFELYRAMLDGLSAPVRLHAALREGRSVKATFQVTPDGKQVAFVSDLRIARRFELYLAPLDGSSAPRQLSQKANGGGDVRQVTFTGDGKVALYLADQDQDEQFELFSVPLDLSRPPHELNAPLVPQGDVSEYALDSTGTWVVYLADQETDESRELYAVPLDRSAAPRRLNHRPFVSSDTFDVGSFQITPDGTRAVYLARTRYFPYSAYLVSLDGSQPARPISPRHSGNLPTWDYRITPDSSRLVYRFETAGLFPSAPRIGLFSVPLDGSRDPVVLQVPSVLSEPYLIAPDGSSIVYASHPASDLQRQIYRVPVDGPREASAQLLADILGDVTQLEEQGSTLVFRAGRDLYSF